MDYEELRPFVIEYLRHTNDTDPLDVMRIVSGTEAALLTRGEYRDAPETIYGTIGTHRMPMEDMEKVRQIISELVNQDVLTWGWDIVNPGPPSVRITAYGRRSLGSSGPTPHDPDGYIEYLKNRVPTLDSIIEQYVTESLQAFLRGLMFSSTVMLGGAAEKAFLLLVDSYTNALADSQKKKKFEKESYGFVKRKIDAFNKEVPRFRDQLPGPLRDDLSVQLDAAFNLIRTCRNDVGHPTGRQIDRRLAFANLQVFVEYCKRVYDLMDFFKPNSLT